METSTTRISLRNIAYASLILGVLGGVLCWWLPMGMVLSLAGLLTGTVGWVTADRRAHTIRLLIGGIGVSTAAFILNLVILALGRDLVVFH